MSDPDSKTVNYWALSFVRLAKLLDEIVHSTSPRIAPAVKAEASRMYVAWIDGLALPEEGFEEAPRRAALLAGLRKRTIEILVRVDSLR
jgi:hypothetical protein